jgi:cobalt-precorrin-5B (C1)-methyltransferase
VPRVTVAGGIAKMTKLAQGRLDLHSKRGSVDLQALADLAREAGADDEVAAKIAASNTALEAFQHAAAAGLALGDKVAEAAWRNAASAIEGAEIALEIMVFDRDGHQVGRTDFKPVHDTAPPRNRRR